MKKLELLERRQEADGVFTCTFDNDSIDWVAGQYMAFVIPWVSDILEQYEHWFTISSAPYQKKIEITVRASDSSFKQALLAMNPGDSIETHTVDGDFAWPDDGAAPVFVAGGIGITPFISMLRQRQHEGKSMAAQLFYYSRPNSDIIFNDELDNLKNRYPELQIVYMDEKPLSADPVLEQLPSPQEMPVFVAGPVPMVDRIGASLEEAGMQVKRDWYFGYDIRNF